VRFLQKSLNLWLRSAGLEQLVVDGDFGRKTKVAVRSFQRAHGLAVDGIVGPITWGALTR
jgi:peptidoglycan hydrolase-like protein with peptidoglycan-binding domain